MKVQIVWRGDNTEIAASWSRQDLVEGSWISEALPLKQTCGQSTSLPGSCEVRILFTTCSSETFFLSTGPQIMEPHNYEMKPLKHGSKNKPPHPMKLLCVWCFVTVIESWLPQIKSGCSKCHSSPVTLNATEVPSGIKSLTCVLPSLFVCLF